MKIKLLHVNDIDETDDPDLFLATYDFFERQVPIPEPSDRIWDAGCEYTVLRREWSFDEGIEVYLIVREAS